CSCPHEYYSEERELFQTRRSNASVSSKSTCRAVQISGASFQSRHRTRLEQSQKWERHQPDYLGDVSAAIYWTIQVTVGQCPNSFGDPTGWVAFTAFIVFSHETAYKL